MSLKWGGQMNNKCIYYVEGPCEQQLIAALKESPSKLIPGKVKVYNVVQNPIVHFHNVSMETIEKICKKLDCPGDEMMEFTVDE